MRSEKSSVNVTREEPAKHAESPLVTGCSTAQRLLPSSSWQAVQEPNQKLGESLSFWLGNILTSCCSLMSNCVCVSVLSHPTYSSCVYFIFSPASRTINYICFSILQLSDSFFHLSMVVSFVIHETHQQISRLPPLQVWLTL